MATITREQIAAINPNVFDEVSAPAFVSDALKGLFLVPEGELMDCPDPQRIGAYSAKDTAGNFILRAQVWPENRTETVVVAGVERVGTFQAGLAGNLVIVNQVPRQVLVQAFQRLYGNWPFRSVQYSSAKLARVLAWLAKQPNGTTDPATGAPQHCDDQYTTEKGYIDDGTAKLLHSSDVPYFGPYTGIAMRSTEDETRFLRVAGFHGIALLHGTRKDKEQTVRDIVPAIFLKTYRHQDGRRLTTADIDALPVITL